MSGVVRKTWLVFLGVSIAAGCAHFRHTTDLQPLPSDNKPRPEFFNYAYGPHERNVFDLWQAKTESPSPLVIFLHGGGFLGGDKWNLEPYLLEQCLANGISVASANYRFSTHQPFPGPMLDGARAIQFIRYKARELRIDPDRIAVVGNSAGAGISLWVGFHDDFADPTSDDKVLRQSSRVTCIGLWGGQSSYDPRYVREVIGGRAYEHPALLPFYGITRDELDTPKAYKLYVEAAPITYLSKDDPPVFAYYAEPKEPLRPGPNTGAKLDYPQFGQEIEGVDRPGWGIHHPKFGYDLQNRMAPLGIECVVRHRDEYPSDDNGGRHANDEFVAFVKKHLGLDAARN